MGPEVIEAWPEIRSGASGLTAGLQVASGGLRMALCQWALGVQRPMAMSEPV